MQKLKQELNANAVGATSSRPHFEGMTQNKGITLIALIITIIVMLILVGVTVNVALNGGLFEKAKTAGSQMQLAADRETLLSAVVAAIGTDGDVDFTDLDANLPTGWTGGNGTYTSPSGNVFTVDADGKITGGDSSSDGPSNNPGTDQVDGTTLISMYRAGEICDVVNCTNEDHLHIGDYVSYTPDTTITTYYPDGEDSTNIGANTGCTTAVGITSLQTVEQEALNWRVLGANGDSVLLISGAPTSSGLQFCGYVGYNNYETILNTACSTLYSKAGIGTARSITMDDVDTYLDGSNYDKTTFDNDGSSSGYYGYTNTNITSEFDYNIVTNTLTKLPKGTTTTLSLTSDAYDYEVSNYITDPMKIDLLQGKNNYYYWVSTRVLKVETNDALWCPVLIFDHDVRAGTISFLRKWNRHLCFC